MNRCGKVYCQGRLAGRIEERPEGYRFAYDTAYLALADASPVSLTLPVAINGIGLREEISAKLLTYAGLTEPEAVAVKVL